MNDLQGLSRSLREHYRFASWALRSSMGLADESVSRFMAIYDQRYINWYVEDQDVYDAIVTVIVHEEYALTCTSASRKTGAFTRIRNRAMQAVVTNISLVLKRCGLVSVDVRHLIMRQAFPLLESGRERVTAFLKPLFVLKQRFLETAVLGNMHIQMVDDDDGSVKKVTLRARPGHPNPLLWDGELYDALKPLALWESQETKRARKRQRVE